MSQLSQQIAKDNLHAYGTSELIEACKALANQLNAIQSEGLYSNGS